MCPRPAAADGTHDVRKRSQLKTKIEGEETWTKRSKASGQFIDQKKAPATKPFKGVRKEKKCGR